MHEQATEICYEGYYFDFSIFLKIVKKENEHD